jgi:class 3 adenylate cyclase/pimeloyl-ACP methyl ester carboxylesterase
MTQAPGGTVTVLFTDLVGSTELRERLGDDEVERLRRSHFRLVRDALRPHGGHEVKTLGDGVMAVFGSALDAVAAAVTIQQSARQRDEEREPDRRVGVRVGLNVGEPIREEDDYFGTAVVVAQRLCDHACGGQVLVSELVRRLIGSRGGFAFRDCAPLQLKGISEPFAACELLWEAQAPARPARRRGRARRAAPVALPPLLAAGERTAFIGREAELAALRRSWQRALRGERRLALITGEPGIGKTRLAIEFAIAAHDEGATALFGRCDEEALVAYQPIVEALRHFVSAGSRGDLRDLVEVSGGAIARLLPELTERLPGLAPPPDDDDETERYHLFQSVASFLAGAAERAPVLLVLDDLNCANEDTLQLLRHLARAPEPSRLLVVGTCRESELRAAHQLSAVLAELRRERGYDRLELAGLGQDDVGVLIDAQSGRACPPEIARLIHDQTEGNPFFIQEVLRHLQETGLLHESGSSLTIAPSLPEETIPQGVKEVIESRLRRLSEECNSLLTIAAVIGREFGLDSLERAGRLPTERALDLLDEAIASGVVREVPHLVGRYSFAHALVYETLYESLATTRRVHLHGQTLQYADSSGAMLAYEVLGSSGPFVVAVGISNCPAVRTRTWSSRQRWDRLARSCRVILYDRRGVGASAAPDRGYSVLAATEDLRAVIDAAGAERVVLWGAADGGPLAISFAAQYPERVAGLLLLGTTAKYASEPGFPWGARRELIDSFLRADAVDRGLAVSELTRSRQTGVEGIAEVMTRVPQRVWPKVIGAIGSADVRPMLPRVRAPTLIIHDPDNTYIPVGAAHYLNENIPHSELDINAEWGLMPLGESVYQRVESFIEMVAAPGRF